MGVEKMSIDERIGFERMKGQYEREILEHEHEIEIAESKKDEAETILGIIDSLDSNWKQEEPEIPTRGLKETYQKLAEQGKDVDFHHTRMQPQIVDEIVAESTQKWDKMERKNEEYRVRLATKIYSHKPKQFILDVVKQHPKSSWTDELLESIIFPEYNGACFMTSETRKSRLLRIYKIALGLVDPVSKHRGSIEIASEMLEGKKRRKYTRRTRNAFGKIVYTEGIIHAREALLDGMRERLQTLNKPFRSKAFRKVFRNYYPKWIKKTFQNHVRVYLKYLEENKEIIRVNRRMWRRADDGRKCKPLQKKIDAPPTGKLDIGKLVTKVGKFSIYESPKEAILCIKGEFEQKDIIDMLAMYYDVKAGSLLRYSYEYARYLLDKKLLNLVSKSGGRRIYRKVHEEFKEHSWVKDTPPECHHSRPLSLPQIVQSEPEEDKGKELRKSLMYQ